ncbi:hypothetical protein [Nocardia grenadensis]|uniref:hypothetical protein n=1 Tax=Nocardia grenadensis TaxID=931537 RepID=UPI003D90155E
MSTTAAAKFLVDLAGRVVRDYDPTLIREIIERASGGELNERRADGQRASTLTISGLPFEASVTGGLGGFHPAIRYVTETATNTQDFSARVTGQLATIQDLVAYLPGGTETLADQLCDFVISMYPAPEHVSARHRLVTWLGIVHHASLPRRAAGLKVYGNPAGVAGGLHRWASARTGFEGLVPIPQQEKVIRPVGAAIEVDAQGKVTPKIYLRARYNDVAFPMKLVRYFGEPAWELLSELVSCGVDAARFHEHDYFVCCTPRTFTLYTIARRDQDLSSLVRMLASRHHGTTDAVDALVRAAESSGATFRYSGVGLGYSAGLGVDKLNVYGTPSWEQPVDDRDHRSDG